MNAPVDKDLFNQLYFRYITVADKYVGGFCVFSTILAVWAYKHGDASLQTVLLVASLPAYHLILSQILKRFPHLGGVRTELLFRILPNTFATPIIFITIDSTLTPWWGIYLCMSMSSVVVMGYRFESPRYAYGMTVFWAVNMLLGKLIIDDSISPYQVGFLAAAILMIGFSTTEWIHQARGTIQRVADQGTELQILVNKLLETEAKLKNSLEKEALAHQNLLEGQHLLQQAQRIAKIGYTILDTKTGKLEWSDELRKMMRLGPKSEAPSFEETIARIHPEDRESIMEHFNLAFKHTSPFESEHRIQNFNGDWLTCRAVFESERDLEGNVPSYLLSFKMLVRRSKTIESSKNNAFSSYQHRECQPLVKWLRALPMKQIHHSMPSC